MSDVEYKAFDVLLLRQMDFMTLRLRFASLNLRPQIVHFFRVCVGIQVYASFIRLVRLKTAYEFVFDSFTFFLLFNPIVDDIELTSISTDAKSFFSI